jgi:hypothetical protein
MSIDKNLNLIELLEIFSKFNINIQKFSIKDEQKTDKLVFWSCGISRAAKWLTTCWL